LSTQAASTCPETVLGLEEDLEAARIVREELTLLSTVLRALDASARTDLSVGRTERAAGGQSLDDVRLLELRDDVAIAKPEDLPALFEQMHHLGALRAQRGRGVSGSIDRACPYFGHMRLEEAVTASERRPGSPAQRRRDVLIGSRAHFDSAAGIRVVDWRNAPVSRIYYRYAEGDEYEEELGGRLVEGFVAARRGVSIVGGELTRVTARQGTFVRGPDGRWSRVATARTHLETEGAWGARHGVASKARLGVEADGALRHDKHLPAIAALLDSRQFELIAQGSGGLMAIQGNAGSGKTTVGLHRIAYLAFTHPRRFRPEHMRVIVPTEALVHYVSRVLPSLGVEGVPVSTFEGFSARVLAHMFPRLPTAVNEDTPPVVSRAKSHPSMLRAIDRLVARVDRQVDTWLREAMAKWPGGEEAVFAWEAAGQSARSHPDMRLAALAHWTAGRRRFADVADASSLPEMTRTAIDRFVAQQRSVTRSASAVWDELLTSRRSLDETFEGQPGFGAGQLDQVHEWCVRQARVRMEGDRDGEHPTIDVEDRAILLRCWQSLRGPIVDPMAKPIRYAHLFVDEVQDASPVELRVLVELADDDRCITLAGDVAQRLQSDGDDRGEFDWDALLDSLGMPHTKMNPLKVSYRSTAEITQFARAVLGPLAHDEVPDTTRHGPPVELFRFASAGEAVAWLADVLKQLARDEPDANVALIARFPQQADVYYDGLSRAEVPNLRRVARQDFSWERGVDVTDVRQTKGLEFDEVILLETTDASYPVTPAGRHALYVAATRASHQLWCLSSDEPSALIAGQFT
jgi:DNA helicase-2/ATP-dependent DNA helicase PcrA